MQTDTENSVMPTVEQAALLWELVLPKAAFDEAAARCIEKGRDDLALYEGTKVFAYQMSLCVITAMFNDIIKLVHFDDNGLLHIFMKNRLPQNHVVQLKRLFDSKMWLPDKVLNDILGGEQAYFSIREQNGNDVLETTFVDLKAYEGPVDYTDIKDQLIAADITDLSTCALVYEVGGLIETPYENARYDKLESRFIGGTERLVDTLMFARELQADAIKRKATIAIAERYFKATKWKAPVKPNTQQKLDAARTEAKEAAVPFKTLKKMKKAAKAK